MDQRDPRARLWALALASAAAASMHELTWGALVSRWVGNSAWSVALALGAFMLGQGAGALWAPRGFASRRAGDGYARCELSIGVGATFALACFARSPPPSSVVGGGVAVDVVPVGVVHLHARVVGRAVVRVREASQRLVDGGVDVDRVDVLRAVRAQRVEGGAGAQTDHQRAPPLGTE